MSSNTVSIASHGGREATDSAAEIMDGFKRNLDFFGVTAAV
jgi:hypothetical protein